MGWLAIVVAEFLEYDTPRIVHIQSVKLGIINRFLQLCIISYIIGYAIIYSRGYQDSDSVAGAIVTKLKGVSLAKQTIAGKYPGVWDVADYVVPPQESNAFFVTTNVVITPDQMQGTCLPDPAEKNFHCKQDRDCPANQTRSASVLTGKCNKSASTQSVCEVHAWCPLEDDSYASEILIPGAENFTVFIKNHIEFPKFGVKRRNIIGFYNNSHMRTCRYSPSHPVNQFCPIFILGEIVKLTNNNFQDMLNKGGMIQIIIQWNCDLDMGEQTCLPKYLFRRLDKSNAAVSPGYNFRYAHFYKLPNKTMARTLVKAYGIHFILTLEGTAHKFSIVPLLLNFGNGLAFLSIATVICDVILLYLSKAKNFYREKKYLTVAGNEKYAEKTEINGMENHGVVED